MGFFEYLDPEEIKEAKFNHFNSDINLLSMHILLEAFSRGENILTLENFIKGDYWKIDEISEEIRDTGDYGSTEDMVLNQVIHIIEDFGVGKVKKVSVVGLSELLETVVKEAVEAKVDDKLRDLEDMVNYYTGVIDQIYKLKKLSDEASDAAVKSGSNTWRDYWDRIDFEPDKYSRNLEYIVHITAPYIEIEIEYETEGVKKLREEMESYLDLFSQDHYLDKLPFYRENRYYFSQQLENFVEYINKLPVINGTVNVPFDVLSEKGFEFVKVVSYLEDQQKLKVRNWGDKNVWNIKFQKTPITIASLIGTDQVDEDEVRLKLDLSFSAERGILRIGKNEIKFRKGTDQYHLLRIVFEDHSELSKEWFYSEIGEKYDHAQAFDDKKFFNAAYQIKQKIIRDTGINDFLITTKEAVTINPKYTK